MKIKFYLDWEKAHIKGVEMGYSGPNALLPIAPYVHHPEDAGIDLSTPRKFEVPPHTDMVIDTYVVFEMPPNSVGLIWPRGGDMHLVGSGVIDEGYKGTIKVRVINYFAYPLVFGRGSSLGQMVIVPRDWNKVGLVQSYLPFTIEDVGRGDSGRINLETN